MPTMTVQEFWSCQDMCNVVVHCANNEQAKRIMRMFRRAGKAWGGKDALHPEKYQSIRLYDPKDTHWSSFRGGTCYTNGGTHGSLELYREWQKDPSACLATHKKGVPWVIIECDELIELPYLFKFDLEGG